MSRFTRIPDFSGLQVAVLGDLIADHWLYAQPTRLSREAPVMVLRHEREAIGAGGVGNVARNLAALGARVKLFAVAGRDAHGRELVRLLEAEGIDVADVETVAGWTTPTKTRVLAAEPRRSAHQVLRIDREPATGAPRVEYLRAHARLAELERDFDLLLVSDYGYGMIGPESVQACERFRRAQKTCVLDPRSSIDPFKAALTALTPNIGELARFAHVDVDRLDDARELAAAARDVVHKLEPRWLLVTRGNLGMALFGEGMPEEGLAVEASGTGEVTDVCGAGDTAAAVFALSLSAGVEPPEAMMLANAAAGVVVMEHGAATCRRNELEAALATAPAPVVLANAEFT